MLVTTTDFINDEDFEVLGLVTGTTIYNKLLGRDVAGYAQERNEARNTAVQKMIENAKELGADAVISMSFSSNFIAFGSAEILAYGTAVKYK